MLRRWWNGWRGFARATADFQSRILLGLFYFFIVTPFGLLVRLLLDPLGIKTSSGSSLFVSREGMKPALEDARKQF